jgi:hypothetical protein
MPTYEDLDHSDILPHAGEVITVTDAGADASATTIPANTTHVFIQIQGADVWITQDGRTPDSGSPPVGKLYYSDPPTDIVAPLNDFRAMKFVTRTGETAYIDVEYVNARTVS